VTDGIPLLRTLVDAEVWQPERLDFAGAVILAKGLKRQPPASRVFGDPSKPFDLRLLVADGEIERLARKAQTAAKQGARAECEIIRTAWIDNNAPKLAERRGIPLEVAEKVLRRAAEKHILSGDFALLCEDGREASVSELLDYPEKWHGLRFADPLEPEYRNDHRIARANLRGGGVPMIKSFAHGGITYKLMRPMRRILVSKGKRAQIVDHVLDILRERGEVFDYGGGVLARIVDYTAISSSKEWVLDHLDRTAEFYSYATDKYGQLIVGADGKRVEKPQDCPPILAQAILAKNGERRLPKLSAVITAPTIRPDGSVFDVPGHDPVSGLLYLCDEDIPPIIPRNPSSKEVVAALRNIWRVVEKFPLAGALDNAVVLAALMTSCVRAALATSPGYAFDAPAAGTGKTLLARVCGALMTGENPDVLPPAGDKDDETRKRLFSALREGRRVLIWDNVRDWLGSASLDAFLTATTYTDRVLGVSRVETLPNRALFLATGNNLRIVSDTCRRVLVARLDAKMDKPYARSFDFCPVQYTLAHRQELVQAVLTIIRGWFACGSPRAAEGDTASYEEWDKLVRQPIMWIKPMVADWLPLVDPLDSVKRAYDQDPETTKLNAILSAWESEFGNQPTSVHDAISEAQKDWIDNSNHKTIALKDALEEIAGQQNGKINSRILGRYIERNRERRVDQRWFMDAGISAGRKRWRVVTDSDYAN